MYHIKEISTDDPLYQRERILRNEVLLRPIGIKDFGWEHKDRQCVHVVAREKHTQNVVGCILLHTPKDSSSGQLMQMAVNPSHQKRGLGKSLVKKCLEVAKAYGLKTVFCNSRETAVGFYEKVGFKKRGNYFLEVGIKHLKMEIEL